MLLNTWVVVVLKAADTRLILSVAPASLFIGFITPRFLLAICKFTMQSSRWPQLVDYGPNKYPDGSQQLRNIVHGLAGASEALCIM